MRNSIPGILAIWLAGVMCISPSFTYSQSYAYLGRKSSPADRPAEQRPELSSILKSLEEQFNVRFNYNSKLLKDKLSPVATFSSDEPLEQILQRLLSPLELGYEKVKDNSYVIVRSSVVADIVVRGTVTDSLGQALPGVSVKLKGGTLGVSTDVSGNYQISLPDGGGTLQFSYIGYITREIPVRSQTTINVKLQDDTRTLDEVVVVGYGSQRKSDITGSVAIVDVGEMKKFSTNDVGQLLQGRASGVVVNSDGQPGAFPQVRIRGIGTFGNSDPLYVIDGVPIDGVPRDFNPNDVQSVQVLKDASAGAVYGSRAANGVIIITTKQGQKDTPLKVEYNAYYGVDDVWQITPVTNRANYQTLNNEARLNAGQLPAPANDPTSSRFIDDIDTDWQKEGLKTGDRQNHNLNFSGGGKNTTYNVSLDYFNNQGTFVGNGPDYKRYTGRVNTSAEKGIFKIGQSLFYAHSNENRLQTGDGVLNGARPPLVNDLVFAIPTMAIYDPANEGGFGGTLSDREDVISLNGIGYNSLLSSYTDVDRTFGNVYGEVKLISKNGHNLKYKLNLAYDRTLARDNTFIPTFNLGYFFPNATARLDDNSRTYGSGLVENTLNYEKTFSKHSLAVLAGQMYQRNTFAERFGHAEGYTKPYLPVLSNGATSTSSGREFVSTLSSYLGRVNYNYDERYLLTATIRRDGSSRFAPENRFGYFPSVALGWRISNEKFFAGAKSVISDLKLRGSWGQLGNQNIGDYRYYPLINPTIPYYFGETHVIGGLQTNVISETIKWETRATTNIGFDATAFNGSIDLSMEYYDSKTTDALVPIGIPASVGSVDAFPVVNGGTLKNSGLELTATYHKAKGDFKFDISANVTTIKNKVLDLGEGVTAREGVGSITEVGGEIGRHYGFIAEGIFQSAREIADHAVQEPGTAVGDIKFKDINGDNVVNALDRTYLGSAIPKFNYGFNFNASYRNFDFTLFASGSADYLINGRLYRDLMHTAGSANYHEDMINRWTSVNTDTDIPRLQVLDPNNNGRNSNRKGWLQNGTYLRLSTISLGYTLPQKLIKGVSRARVNVTAQNLYTFQEYKGYNPDFTAGVWEPGFDNGSYPKPRTIMLGVQVAF